MTLVSPWGSEVRLWTAGVLALLAFGTPVTSASFAWPFGLFVLVYLLSHASGSSAPSATISSREIVAHHTFRPSVKIPLGSIAAVSVRERRMFTRTSLLPQPLSFISIFRKDVASVIEICAPSAEAEPFLAEVARNARRQGVSELAPFSIPRLHYVRDVLPLVPAAGVTLMFPFAVSWSAFALGGLVLLLHSALAWYRFARLARGVAARVVHPELASWATRVTGTRALPAGPRDARASGGGPW